MLKRYKVDVVLEAKFEKTYFVEAENMDQAQEIGEATAFDEAEENSRSGLVDWDFEESSTQEVGYETDNKTGDNEPEDTGRPASKS